MENQKKVNLSLTTIAKRAKWMYEMFNRIINASQTIANEAIELVEKSEMSKEFIQQNIDTIRRLEISDKIKDLRSSLYIMTQLDNKEWIKCGKDPITEWVQKFEAEAKKITEANKGIKS